MSHDYEFYETPETSTKYLFNAMLHRGHQISGNVVEPCVGSEAIMRAAASSSCWWQTNDLDPRWPASLNLDATQASTWLELDALHNARIDWTVTNPPFSIAVDILNYAWQFSAIGVAMHLRASFHEPLKTGLRRALLRDRPPTGILWLPRFAFQRSKKTGEWTTDSVTCCWLIWVKHARHQFVDYAPEWVIDGLDGETKYYRTRMDALMAKRKEVA